MFNNTTPLPYGFKEAQKEMGDSFFFGDLKNGIKRRKLSYFYWGYYACNIYNNDDTLAHVPTTVSNLSR
jgi:hypothetical protein